MDRQAEAYRHAHPADWATTDIVAGAVVHEPGDTTGIRSPEEWHATGWDDDRGHPKTITEAQALLAARIADPDAPDDETVAGAYDNLQGST